jgi:putative ABC transport system permease protein
MKAGVNAVRTTKLRSFWTMLGVIIGVASVITIVAIGTGIKRQVSDQIHHFGNNLITVRPAQIQTNSTAGASGLSIISGLSTTGSLTDKDVKAVSQVPGVAASAPLTALGGDIRGNTGRYDKAFVIGTSGDLPSLINQYSAYGGFIDDDAGGNVAVLGQRAAEHMFDVDVPLGRTVTVHGEHFIVHGVFNQFTAAPLSQGLDFNDAVFIPNDKAEELSNSTAPTYEILARPDRSDNTRTVADGIRKALARNHGGDSGFTVLTGNQNLAASDQILSLLTKLIAGVASIALLVSGIGIMNVMLVSVSERKHEIGIRKAVGATNRQVLSQFMIESSVLSLWGGIIGIILAFLMELILRLFTDLTPVISWQVVVLATGVSLLVGIVFGTVPAVKAARKDPIEALRSE